MGKKRLLRGDEEWTKKFTETKVRRKLTSDAVQMELERTTQGTTLGFWHLRPG